MADFLGDLEKFILVAILRGSNDSYGVEIRARINKATNKDHSVATVYKTLDRLEQKGFVSSRKGEATPERGGRAKFYYSVTGTGQAALSRSYQALKSVGFLEIIESNLAPAVGTGLTYER